MIKLFFFGIIFFESFYWIVVLERVVSYFCVIFVWEYLFKRMVVFFVNLSEFNCVFMNCWNFFVDYLFIFKIILLNNWLRYVCFLFNVFWWIFSVCCCWCCLNFFNNCCCCFFILCFCFSKIFCCVVWNFWLMCVCLLVI